MRPGYALAYLRQLCCLGFDKEILIPEFLRTVQYVIPSSCNVFVGSDAHFNYRYHLLEFLDVGLEELTPFVVPGFFSPQLRNGMLSWFKQHPVLPGWESLNDSFFKSDMYNVIYRRLDQHYGIHAPVLKFGEPIGFLNLFRSSHEKPFNKAEQSLMMSLLPYISHALDAPLIKELHYTESGSHGLFITNVQGDILYLSNEAKTLLALAYYPLISDDQRSKEAELLATVAKICRNLNAIFLCKCASPPTFFIDRPKGRFVFRAYWLNKQNTQPGGLIGITIEHQEPQILLMMRALRNAPLSPCQLEVALLLAQGFSSKQIGQRMHIKPYTVKDHIEKIFNKLDIHSRKELKIKLSVMEKCKG